MSWFSVASEAPGVETDTWVSLISCLSSCGLLCTGPCPVVCSMSFWVVGQGRPGVLTLLFVKGQIADILGFAGHMVPVVTILWL